MRVLTLSTLFPDATRPNFGLFVERQTRGLAERPGVEVQVVAPVGLPPLPLSLNGRHRRLRGLPTFETWRGLPVHRPRFGTLPGLPRVSPAALARAVSPVARTFRPDVIDAEFFWPDGPAAEILARRLGVPFSIKGRGTDIHLWGTRRGTAAQVRQAGRAASGLLAVSEALRQDMIAFGLPGDRIAVHRTGVDRDRFHPGPNGPRLPGPPRLLAVGALVPVKRHYLAVQAMAHLPEAELAIVGEGPERPALAAEISRLGLADRVRLLGARPHSELPDLLRQADAMLLMSEREGLANAWVEALACGTPLLIPDVGAAREVLNSAEAGLLTSPEPKAIADAARALLAIPPSRERVARAAAPFSWERNAAELEAHLRRIAGR